MNLRKASPIKRSEGTDARIADQDYPIIRLRAKPRQACKALLGALKNHVMDPVLTATIEDFIEDRLLPLLIESKRESRRIRWELKKLRADSLRENDRIDKVILGLSKDRDQQLDSIEKQLKAARIVELKADSEAADRFGDLWLEYHPADPSVTKALMVQPMSREMAAVKSKRTSTSVAQKVALKSEWYWVVNSVGGAVGGLSVGLLSGGLSPRIADLATRPIDAMFWIIAGICSFTASRKSIEFAFGRAGQRASRPWRALGFGLPLLNLGVIITIWLVMDREGILRSGALRPGGLTVGPVILSILGLTLTIGSLLYSAYWGLVLGEQQADEDIIVATRDEHSHQMLRVLQQHPATRELAKAANRAIVAKFTVKTIEDSRTEIIGRCTEMVSAAEAQRIPYPDGPTEQHRQRLATFERKLISAQKELDNFLDLVHQHIRDPQIALQIGQARQEIFGRAVSSGPSNGKVVLH